MTPSALFDTHTHFDDAGFDASRPQLAEAARQQGVQKLVLAGYAGPYFDRLMQVNRQLNAGGALQSHAALGLHPMYQASHQPDDLYRIEQAARQQQLVAIGEIGLDSFLTPAIRLDPQLPFTAMTPEALATAQRQTFTAQLELAKQYDLPVILHIRKQHAEALKIIKDLKFTGGGIAHAFSGGEQEARQFVQLGFKLGITGLACDPNAKKLHRAIQVAGLSALVAETDCPDLTPLPARQPGQHTPNQPAYLPFVVQAIGEVLQQPAAEVSQTLWHNSHAALRL